MNAVIVTLQARCGGTVMWPSSLASDSGTPGSRCPGCRECLVPGHRDGGKEDLAAPPTTHSFTLWFTHPLV